MSNLHWTNDKEREFQIVEVVKRDENNNVIVRVSNESLSPKVFILLFIILFIHVDELTVLFLFI